MRIGELARRTGVGVSTLRAWETRFAFLEPERSGAGHRLYRESDVSRVEAVLRLLSEGLTLPAAVARVSSGGAGALPDGEGEALFFGHILQAAAQGIWVTHVARTRFANRRMAEMLRCPLDELLVRSARDFIPPEDMDGSKERMAQLRAGHKLHLLQRLVRADGTTFLAEVDVSPLFNHRGTYEGSVASVIDVTARHEIEAQAQFRSMLLDAIDEAVVVGDADGRISYVNARAERLFGWRASDVIGTEGRVLLPAPEALEEADRIHRRLLSGKRFSGPLKLTRFDHSVFDAHLTSSPVYDADGKLLGLLAVISDQTDQTRQRREKRVLESQIETLALLGAQALGLESRASPNADVLVTEAVEVARRLLEADRVVLLDVVPGADKLLVRVAAPATEVVSVPGGSRSSAGYVAVTGRALIVRDHDDQRFDPLELWPEYRRRSALAAPVFGPDGVCGVLEVFSDQADQFGPSTDHFLQGLANVIGAALAGHPDRRRGAPRG